MKVLKKLGEKLSFFKRIKKSTWISIGTNLILAICIFSAFNMCFKVDAKIVSSTGYSAIYRGNEQNKNASLMINVYWGTEYIEPMLKVLKDKNVKTTFFVGGYWVAQNEELLSKIVEDGHEIANHGYYHKDQGNFGLERNLEEIKMNHTLVKQTCGVEMNLFAPPSGSYNSSTLQAAEKLGYKTIMWSKDTIDWRDKNADLIFSRATKNMQNGDLILMHPTKCTFEALEKIIDAYQNAGFTLTTVSQTIA